MKAAAPGFAERLRRHAGSIEKRLVAIALAALAPLALLSFGIVFEQARAQQRDLARSINSTASALGVAVDAELNQALAALDTLAASPSLAAGDLMSFDNEARALLSRRQPLWLNVTLSTPSARQVVNAYLPRGAPLPSGVAPADVTRAARSGRPQVSDLVDSRTLGRLAIGLFVPVHRQGEVAWVLTAVVSPQLVQEVIERQAGGGARVVAVMDRARRIVARSPAQPGAVGQLPVGGLLPLLDGAEASGSGNGEAVTREGVPARVAFERAPTFGWWVAVAWPQAVIQAPLARAVAVLGLSIVLSVLVGLGAASVIARSLLQPLQGLERAADALARGEPPQVPPTPLPALAALGAALGRAHVDREARLAAEHKALEGEHAARVAAEQASRSKDEFLAMLGHELRNPLAAISGAAAVLERTGGSAMPADAPPRRARDVIVRQVRHLARLTDDLLDASRVVSGKVELRREPVDLADIARRAADTLREAGALNGHQLALTLSPACVLADATRLEQIIMNLLGNAVKFTPEPSRIALEVRRDGGMAVLTVRDPGIGMEPELLARVFDLFVQGGGTPDRGQRGLGIGLTLVRHLAELHGGRVAAESAGPGQGSTLSVHLPLLPDADAPCPPAPIGEAAAPPGADVRGPVRRRRVAIVEDNADVRATLRQVLSAEGHEVHEAADGQAGLELILRERPDVALVDIGLPQFDGLALARSLRIGGDAADEAAGRPRPTRLVAISGYGSAEDLERGRRAGFDDYLVKPLDPGALLRLVNAAG